MISKWENVSSSSPMMLLSLYSQFLNYETKLLNQIDNCVQLVTYNRLNGVNGRCHVFDVEFEK